MTIIHQFRNKKKKNNIQTLKLSLDQCKHAYAIYDKSLWKLTSTVTTVILASFCVLCWAVALLHSIHRWLPAQHRLHSEMELNFLNSRHSLIGQGGEGRVVTLSPPHPIKAFSEWNLW